MIHDSDQCFDSSNAIRQTRQKTQFQMAQRIQPSRRKIYADNDFKEVVKNFYNLIAEINRTVRRFSKNIKKSQTPQNQKKGQLTKKQQQQQFQDLKKNADLYNFKKDVFMDKQLQSYQQMFKQTFTTQLMQQLSIPNSHQDYSQMMHVFTQNQAYQLHHQQPQKSQTFQPKFKRNSYHIAIAYTTYIRNQGTNINENQDPTFTARKKMRDSQKDLPKKEEEKQVSQQQIDINQSFEEDKKKPLEKLVMELEKVDDN